MGLDTERAALEAAIVEKQRERQRLMLIHREEKAALASAATKELGELDLGGALTAARAARMRRPASASFVELRSDWRADAGVGPPPWLSQAGAADVKRERAVLS